MKIKEVIERECCANSDLKPYLGKTKKYLEAIKNKIFFCVHCGQIWYSSRQPGDMDSSLEAVKIDWE
jgi:hypothetical protein